jgi:YegS/Rv2252/BmrU family lipid kinase
VKVAVILNGISLKKKFFYSKIMPALQKTCNADVFETHTRHDAIFLASKLIEKKYNLILAAGGDGTVNQVVNGMLKGRVEIDGLPILGIIPIGSGNDFARTLNISSNVGELTQRVESAKYKTIDVGKVSYYNENGAKDFSYFVNVADAGMGPEVVKKVTQSDRLFGAAMAYYSAILSTFSQYKPMNVHVKTDQWEWEGKLNTLAVGNGRYYGHGLCIAPDAVINDGKFATFICGDASKLEFIWHSGRLKAEKKIVHPKVRYDTATRIELTSDQPCLIEADGEWLGMLPATIEIIPNKLKVLC